MGSFRFTLFQFLSIVHVGPESISSYVDAWLKSRDLCTASQESMTLRISVPLTTVTLLNSQWTAGRIDHPDIPLYISAVGPYMLKLAGELCDGVHVHPFHSRDYLDGFVLPKLAEGALRSNRDVDEVIRFDELRGWLEAAVEMSYQSTGYRRVKNPRIWTMHDLGVLVSGVR